MRVLRLSWRAALLLPSSSPPPLAQLVRRASSTAEGAAAAAAGADDRCTKPSETPPSDAPAPAPQGSAREAAETDSSDAELSEEARTFRWQSLNGSVYGEGNYALFRPLYKDLCDEMRREFYTKPPPPFPVPGGGARAAGGVDCRPAATTTTAAAAAAASSVVPPTSFADSSAGSVEWTVVHQPANNLLLFRRPAVARARQGRVVAFSRVEQKDPVKLNALLTFADWCPIEVLVEQNGVVVQFSVACNEGGMHLRNVRAYEAPAPTSTPSTDASASATPANLLDSTDDAEWCRQNLCYDGPCLWHLELDFLNELYDVMQDHGVTLDWVRWASEWVYYVEHTCYARWAAGMLEELIPSPQRGPEEDFLLPQEQELLDEPAEDWLSARTI